MNRFIALIVVLALVPSLAPAQTPGPSPSPRAPAPSDARPPQAPAALRLSVAESVLMALERNAAFRVQRLTPAVTRTGEDKARAAFDPSLTTGASRTRRHAPEYALQSGTTSEVTAVSDHTAAEAALGATLPSGTRVALNASTDLADAPHESAESRLGVTVTQPLLEGFGPGPTLVELRQARLDTRMSVYELHGFAMALVADVEQACWIHVLALAQRDAYADALRVAERQLDETRERIRVGKLPALDAVAAESEVALRRESLIRSGTEAEAARLHLVRLLNPPGPDLWQTAPVVTDAPEAPADPLDPLDACVAAALRTRPDLAQARLAVARGDLELVKTRNGLLPKLDVFVSLGRSAYAAAFKDTFDSDAHDGHDTAVGVTLELPLLNRGARADHRRALLTRDQAADALAAMDQLAQEDVRLAWTRADRSREQVAATRATLTLQERKLAAESAKFREGASTPLLVAQAERDLLQSRIAHTQAVVAAILARTDLYRQDGSLLRRRNLSVPEEN